MSAIRVYSLAQELKINKNEVLEILKRNHIEVKNSMSPLDENAVEVVKRTLAKQKASGRRPGQLLRMPTATKPPQAKPTEAKPAAPPAEKPAAKPPEKPIAPAAAKLVEKPAAPKEEKPVTAAKPAEPKAVKPAEKPTEKAVEKSAAKPAEKPVAPKDEKPVVKDGGTAAEKPAAKPAEKSAAPKADAAKANAAKAETKTVAAEKPPVQKRPEPPSAKGGEQGAAKKPQGQPQRQGGAASGGNQAANQNRDRNQGNQRQQPANAQNRPPTAGQRPAQNAQGGQKQGQGGQKPQTAQSQGQGGANQGGGKNRRGGESQGRQGGNKSAGHGNKTNAAKGRGDKGGARNSASFTNEDSRNPKARGGKGRDRRGKGRDQAPQKPEIVRPKKIRVGETIAVKELAIKMGLTAVDVIKKLMLMGVLTTINQEIDYDTAALVADSFGIACEELPPETDPTLIPEIEDSPQSLVLRPPVVTVMGHVDHGKTSLLDCIRSSSVTSQEAGGITQRIGAYQVNCNGKKIVFLDTPGHEAFTAMRARGAQVTDIAVLVVAADDGVMPQTIEAINHAKSANVPILVAINKIDKPGANPDHVKQQLAEQGIISEEWGGESIMVPVSAKKKIGIEDLLESILLVAEVAELKANPAREARGVIIEAQLDKGRGPVATVLVQSGTLRVGDSIIAGMTYGKVRAMVNDRGDAVKKAGPSMPVEVLGLGSVPEAGDDFAVLDEKLVRSIAEKRQERQRSQLVNKKKVSLDDLFQQIQEGSIKDLNIVIKADVQGSVEALISSLTALNKNNEVRVSVVHSGVGAVSESDVMLAAASNALIIAFSVRPDNNARRLAETEKVDIRPYQVIYDVINDVKDAMTGMLAPKYKEVIQGRVEIRKVMTFDKLKIAGSYVLEGKVTNNSKIRILRDNVIVHDGQIDSLRRFKDDVKEVASGYECGLTLKDYRDFKEGDILEVYTMEEIAATLADLEGPKKAGK